MARVLLFLIVILVPGRAPAQTHPDFSGTWTFDASQTDVNGRISWPSQLVITQTPAQIQVEGSATRQAPVRYTHRFDGSEATFPPDAAGITVSAKASWTEDKLSVASRRTFNTPTGAVTVNLAEVYGLAGDLLTVERTEGTERPIKIVYHRGTATEPRVAAARPNRPSPTATGPITRTADGKPDFQGYWTARGRSATDDVEPHPASYAVGAGDGVVVDPPDGRLPVQPWIDVQRHYRAERLFYDPEAHCFPSGVPRMMYNPMPFQIIYFPGSVLMLYDSRHLSRTIRMNTRSHPSPNVKLWMGDSYGHWEGDTLVIDSSNFNGKTWLDMAGNMTSDNLHVTERLWLVDANTIGYEATLTDPKVYTRPWTMAFTIARNRDDGFEILEGACQEGNQDVDLLRKTNPAAAREGPSR